MSLNYNLKALAAPELDAATEKEQWPITSAIIQMMYPMGISHLKTNKDVDEMYFRVKYYESIEPRSYPQAEVEMFTYKNIKLLQGVTTNVYPETRAAFLKRMMAFRVREVEARIKYDKQNAEAFEEALLELAKIVLPNE